LASKRQT